MFRLPRARCQGLVVLVVLVLVIGYPVMGNRYSASVRLVPSVTWVVLAGIVLALSSRASAEHADGTQVLVQEDFGPECAGWSMTEWRDPRGGGWRPSENYVRLEDGLLKVFLGRGMMKRDKDDLWHGKTVSRPLHLYTDFRIDCLMKWVERGAGTIMQADVGLESGSTCIASAWMRDAWSEGRGIAAGDVMGFAVASVGEVPLTGQARIRFERTGGVLSLLWEDKLLAHKELASPITAFVFTVKGYHAYRAEGDHAALDYLRVCLPKPSVKLRKDGLAAVPPNLLAGGDFEDTVKATADRDAGNLVLKAEGLKGVSIGRILGWETDIDGANRILEAAKPGPGRHLRLETSQGKEISFVSESFPVEPGAEYLFSGLTRVENFGDKAVVSLGCVIERFDPKAGWGSVLFRPDLATGTNDWNWKRTLARFAVPGREAVKARVTLSARAEGEGGAALFDALEIRKLTQRELERDQMAALGEGLLSLTEKLTQASFQLETTLEALGFDLAAIKGREQQPALAAEAAELSKAKTGLADTVKSARQTYRASGEIIQFCEQVADEEIAKLLESAKALQDVAHKLLVDKDLRETRLRQALEPLRRPRERPAFKDNFDWARSRFHLYWQNHYGLDPPGLEDALRYMGEMHTAILQETPCFRRPADSFRDTRWSSQAEYARQILSMADREGIRTLFFAPGVSPHPSGREGLRKWIKTCFEMVGDHPAFAGLEFDEISNGCGWCGECRREFRKYLKVKYSAKQLVELGILQARTDDADLEEAGKDDQEETLAGTGLADPEKTVEVKPEGPIYDLGKLFPPEPEEREDKKVLWMEHREFVAQTFEMAVKDAFDYAHSLRKDALMAPILSPGPILQSPLNSSLANVSAMADMIGIDPYWNGCPEEAFYCDLMRANAKGPTLITVGTCYGGSVASLKRDLSICFSHADGMYVFDWPFVFKQPPYLKPEWASMWMPGAWEHVWDTFQKAHRLEPYLVRTESPANVAMLYSERSSSIDFYKADVSHGMGGHYSHQQMGLYCLFMQARIQVDSLFAEGLKPDKLDRYSILYVQNAAALTPEQEDLLRSWVKDGGKLIATASTTILDHWGRKQTDYRLADVFGVRYIETRTAGQDAAFGENPRVSYGHQRSLDIVEPTTAKVVSAWAGGAPAVVTNPYGKGTCIFISASDLGLCYAGRARKGITERFPVHKKFLSGVREFISGLVLDALKARGRDVPFRVANCPDEVETVIRVQTVDGRQRRILHLLNYGFEEPIRGVRLDVPTDGKPLRVFYPTDGKALESSQDGKRAAFVVRDFDVHEAVVIEEDEKH